MSDPTTCSVVCFRRFVTIVAQPFDKVEQRLVTFAEIGAFGQPVVHLSVDVDGPV